MDVGVFMSSQPHLNLNILVNPNAYSTGINVSKHFTIVFYSKDKELPVLDRFRNWLYSGEANIFNEFSDILELVSA